jgi:hypothetical protein
MKSIALVLLCLAGIEMPAIAQSREAMERDYVRGVVYLVTASEPAYEKPDVTSKRVGALKQANVGLLVFGTVEGWVWVGLPWSDTFERGWIRGNPANLIKGDQLTVPGREVRMKDKKWPAALRLDILRGNVRLGFTKEQVEIARDVSIGTDDDPRKESEETAAGVTEVWTYPDAVYTFNSGKVVKIKKIE